MSDNPPAFPFQDGPVLTPGMTLRDYFAGQALANQAICTGTEPEWRLANWFGNRTGITRGEIAAKQAGEYADAMLSHRGDPS